MANEIRYNGREEILKRIIDELNHIQNGSVEDVKVNGVSVVDLARVANIDLSDYATAEELAEVLTEYSKTTEFARVAFSGNYGDLSGRPSIPTKTSDLQNNGDGTSIFTTKSYVDTAIENLPEPMIFKGTLGTGGTITTLPTASSQNEGFTYKVITDGTYASQDAKVGDVFISNGSSWVLIPSGDTDSDTWREIKINGNEFLGNAISTGAVNFKSGTNTIVSGSGHDIQIDAVVPTKTSDLTNDGEDGTNVFVANNDSRLSDSRTPKSHTHGSITNGGAITANTAIENTDRLVFVDANDSNKLKRSSEAFDGSTTTKALTPKGTFESFAKAADIPTALSDLSTDATHRVVTDTQISSWDSKGTSNLTLGTSSTTAYRGDRGNTAYTHATDSGRLTTATTSGLYKVGSTAQGHISELVAVEKADITALGIPASDTNTHRPIQLNGTQILGNNTTVLNLKNGDNISMTNSSGTVTINATGIPTKTSDLTNDSNFVSDANYVHTDVNFTSSLKSKLDGIATGAEVNVQSDWNATSGDAQILNKPSLLTLGESSTTAYRGDRGKTAYTHASDSSRLTTATATGLYKVGCTAQGHISELTAVAKADITALGIPGSDTNTIPSGYCTTAAATAAKEASCTGYNLTSKTFLQVIITNTNTAKEKLTLSINGKTAKDIWINGTVTSADNYSLTKGSYIVYYDGSKYLFRTDGKLLTTSQIVSFPSNMTTNELTTGTATTARTMRADYLKTGINLLIEAFEASKSCIVGSDASANLYFHVFTLDLGKPTANTDFAIMLSVNNTFSSNTASKEGAGMLYIHFRAKTDGSSESMAMKFVSKVNLNNDDFKLGYSTYYIEGEGTGIQYELWTKIDTRWMFRRFTIMSQGFRKEAYNNIITLDSDTTGSSSLPARVASNVWISAS